MFPFTKEELQQEIDSGYVNVQKHKNYDLYIYNYSVKCQFEQHWNIITETCRGLILDGDFNIIARPFKKFFNFEEVNYNVPNEEWEATEKLDGVLFIVCRYLHFIITATRGSFNSDQCFLARRILYEKYLKNGVNPFESGVTYLFELLSNQYKIVCNYEGIEDIILLATIDNKTGYDTPGENPPRIGFSIVSFYTSGKNLSHLIDLKKLNTKNKEGFVIKFLKSGIRIKIKFEDYIRLHKIITRVSTKTIWEYLKDNRSFDEILENVPDEFFNWVKDTKKKLQQRFDNIKQEADVHYTLIQQEYEQLGKFKTKKDMALYIQTLLQQLQPILYAMVDGKPYSQIIWKSIKPKFEKPFKIDQQDDM